MQSFLSLILILSLLQGSQCAKVKDFTGCCLKVKIENDSDYEGEYEFVDSDDYIYYGHLEYKHVNKELYIMFLKDKWVIATDFDGNTVKLENSRQELCVDEIKESKWIDSSNNEELPNFNITCNDRQVGKTKCMYRHGVRLEGGDLPDAFGGQGGQGRERPSYKDCLKQCSHRSGIHCL